MKNIHVIPTDKPSRLRINSKGKLILSNIAIGSKGETQHIYITSDEEIKEGIDQWYLDKVLNKPYNSGGAQYSSKQDVIILTTDEDLIKDSVQAINNEFLEWFVKNPSCEEVEVNDWLDDKGNIAFNGKLRYQIIIPNEEPEFIQINQDNPVTRGSTALVRNPKYQREMTQETLEEAAENYGNSIGNKNGTAQFDFIRGAKWQQERMYSEAIDLFIDEIKSEFKDDNWDYLEFIKERVLNNLKIKIMENWFKKRFKKLSKVPFNKEDVLKKII